MLFVWFKQHNGPYLRSERTTENWAYGHFHAESSAFINLDVSVGYDQISGQVSARVHKFSSQHGLAVQHNKSGELWLDHVFWLASKHMQPHIHHLEIGYVAYGKIISFVKANIDYV